MANDLYIFYEGCLKDYGFDFLSLGIRLYDETINRYSTDELEAKALSFKRDMIDIYSNSWGPGDRAFEVEGPGSQLRDVLYNGTRLVLSQTFNSLLFWAINSFLSEKS